MPGSRKAKICTLIDSIRSRQLRYLPPLLLFTAVACTAFAYWGLKTKSGRAAFDEMAGIIPMGVGALGAILALAAVVAWWWLSRRA